MKNTAYLLLLLGFATLSACQKKGDVEPEDNYPFVEGDLLLGIRDGVPIERVFRLADSLNFPIIRMNGFFYHSGLPKDSVAYLKRLLTGKPYLNKGSYTGSGVYFYSTDNKIRILNPFFDMTAASQQDWLATIPQLQLTNLPDRHASLQVKVPVGEEKQWRTELRKNRIVEWAELNSYNTVKPL